MNIPQIRIDRVDAKLSIQVDRGSLSVQQPHAKIDIKNNLPVMEVHNEKGQLQIDQSRALAAYGLMNPVKWTKHLYDNIMRIDILQGIANIAQNGDLLADVGRKNVTVADIAKQNSTQERKLNVVGGASFLNVDLEYLPDDFETRLKEGYPDIKITAHQPIIDYQPSRLNIQMQQYPSIAPSWESPQVDLRI